MRKKITIGFWAILALFAIAFAFLQTKTYSATENAVVTWEQIAIKKSGYDYFPAENPKASLIFYGGGLVREEAYAPLASKLADAGIDVYLVVSPLELPIFSKKRAEEVIKTEKLDKAYLAGHSLGGVVSAMSAEQLYEENKLAGLIFLASYPSDEIDISQLNLPVLSITASQDKVLDLEKYEEAKKRLPQKTEYFQIQGGNHSGFGSYGRQEKDGKASLSPSEQENSVVDKILDFIQEQEME